MQDLEFYLDWFNKEADRRIALENSLNIPIGILSITFGAAFYLLVRYNFEHSPCLLSYLFCTALLVSALFSIWATYYLFISYHGITKSYTDKGFPIASELRKHKQDLIDYYLKNAESHPNDSGLEKFEEYLITKLTEYIDRNVKNNDKKSEALYQAKGKLLYAILCLVLALVPFLVNFFQK